MTGRVRRAHRHFDAGLGPERRDPRRVQLRTTGLGVVEITPGEDRNTPQSGGGGQVAELGDNVGIVHAHTPESLTRGV